MQRKIKRTNLLPQPLDLGTELVGSHVIACAPECACVLETKLLSSLVRKLDKSPVALAHGSAYFVPSHPNVLQFVGIAAVSHDPLDRGNVEAVVGLAAVLSFSVVRIKRSGDLRHLFSQCWIFRSGRSERQP